MTDARRRLLVVEDSPEDREAYRRAFDGRYQLIETDSGEEAVRLLAESTPDCVLLDYRLHDTDAIDFLRRLKAEAGTFPCPIVVITGKGDERVAVQAMKLGVENYVVKGDLGDLASVVADAIERHDQRKQGEPVDFAARSDEVYKLLIVDDSPEDREYFKRRLGQQGPGEYRFKEAETCAEGLAVCEEWKPDCVILDYALPDSDGLNFLAQVCGSNRADGVAVVVVTGQGNEAVAVSALKLGAQDYVVKSSAIEMLRAAIHGAVEKVRLQRKIEEQRRALEHSERMLREADRRKDEFLAVLAHELRNPLASMRSSLEVMRLRRLDGNTMDFVRDVFERQVGHLARLVDDLLDVSRITHGTVHLQPARLDLGRTVRQAADDYRDAIEAAGLSLGVEVPELPLWVQGDAVRLAQILANLLSNSVKFTQPGGCLTVSVAAEGRTAHINVADTGRGIEPELLARMFQPFAQADRSVERRDGGLGLGLTIAKGLVELHGGTIEVDSEGLGKGAHFRINLPLEGEPPVLNESPGVAPIRTQHGRRVLIVEDNPDAAETLRLLLELQQYEVKVASNGPDGVRLAAEWLPDAVLCDIGLPGIDGFAVARAIRRNPATRQANLIAVTGYGSQGDRDHAIASGFDHLVVKPADPYGLLKKLELSD